MGEYVCECLQCEKKNPGKKSFPGNEQGRTADINLMVIILQFELSLSGVDTCVVV